MKQFTSSLKTARVLVSCGLILLVVVSFYWLGKLRAQAADNTPACGTSTGTCINSSLVGPAVYDSAEQVWRWQCSFQGINLDCCYGTNCGQTPPPPPPPVCGNNVVETGEFCDGTDLNGATCISQGYKGGTLKCAPNCNFDSSLCTLLPNCGNGIIDDGEFCDGNNLNGATCQSLGFATGTLACLGNCEYDLSKCSNNQAICGNGIIEAGEQCEGTNFQGLTCSSMGCGTGDLRCFFCQIDKSQCSDPGCSGGGGGDGGGTDGGGILGDVKCVKGDPFASPWSIYQRFNKPCPVCGKYDNKVINNQQLALRVLQVIAEINQQIKNGQTPSYQINLTDYIKASDLCDKYNPAKIPKSLVQPVAKLLFQDINGNLTKEYAGNMVVGLTWRCEDEVAQGVDCRAYLPAQCDTGLATPGICNEQAYNFNTHDEYLNAVNVLRTQISADRQSGYVINTNADGGCYFAQAASNQSGCAGDWVKENETLSDYQIVPDLYNAWGCHGRGEFLDGKANVAYCTAGWGVVDPCGKNNTKSIYYQGYEPDEPDSKWDANLFGADYTKYRVQQTNCVTSHPFYGLKAAYEAGQSTYGTWSLCGDKSQPLPHKDFYGDNSQYMSYFYNTKGLHYYCGDWRPQGLQEYCSTYANPNLQFNCVKSNGLCGGYKGKTFASADWPKTPAQIDTVYKLQPAALCAVGEPSYTLTNGEWLPSNGQWLWQCKGWGGGANASCSAKVK